MRFMIIRKADANTEASAMPTEALVDAMMAYNEEMIRAGVMVGGDGLKPSDRGARITFRDGAPTVTDGPFTEAKELVAGYTLINVASRDEALEWVRRWPAEDADGHVELELRELYEADDFGDEFTHAIRHQEELLRAHRRRTADDPPLRARVDFAELRSSYRQRRRCRAFAGTVPAPESTTPRYGDTTMRFMILFKANTDSEAGAPPSEQLITEMGRYNEELVKAGVLLAGEGLHPSSRGVRVRSTASSARWWRGPFAETTGAARGLLAPPGQVARRGRRVGQAHAQPGRRGRRGRDPPGVRRRRLCPRRPFRRAARRRGAPPRAGRGRRRLTSILPRPVGRMQGGTMTTIPDPDTEKSR